MAADDLLARRLSACVGLGAEDYLRLKRVTAGHVRHIPAREDLIGEGQRPRAVFLILSGWAIRYKTLMDGRRQILAFLLPGDLCDLHNGVLSQMDHAIGALTSVRCVEIPNDRIDTVMAERGPLAHALQCHTLVTSAIQREWIVSLGQRSAFERLGHLFCELFTRLQLVGLADDLSCEMPPTQLDLADTVGITAVHVNRTLQEMRANRLINLRERRLEILDMDALARAVLFSPDYLHLKHKGQADGASAALTMAAPQ